MRKMRRFKQELSYEKSAEVLDRNTNGVLALIGDEGYPYGVPISYVFVPTEEDGLAGRIYFHSSKSGYKVDCINACPKASFTVIDEDQIVPEEYTTYFRSVIATGKVRLVEGDERRDSFMALVEKYSGSMPAEAKKTEVDGCTNAAIYALDIEILSGKEAIEFVKQEQ